MKNQRENLLAHQHRLVEQAERLRTQIAMLTQQIQACETKMSEALREGTALDVEPGVVCAIALHE